MRTSPVLTLALLVGLALASTASANPITDPSSVNQESNAGGVGFESLFDVGGLPFLLTSGPSYFHLAPHGKLRGFGPEFDGDGDGDGGFGALFSSGGGAGSGDSGGGSGDSGGSDVSLSSSSNGDPGSQDGDSDDPGAGGLSSNAQRVPEPATLLLLVPAAALMRRRRSVQ